MFTEIDRAIPLLATLQHGVFTHAQVVAAGGTQNMIHTRLRTGQWIRLASGVYALASAPRAWRQRATAATIGHPNARLDLEAAAKLHGFEGFARRSPKLDLLVPQKPTTEANWPQYTDPGT